MASLERVQQRLHPERRFGEQDARDVRIDKDLEQRPILQRTGDQTLEGPQDRFRQRLFVREMWSSWRKSEDGVLERYPATDL